MHRLTVLSEDAPGYVAALERTLVPELEVRGFTDVEAALEGGSGCDVLLADPYPAARFVGSCPMLRWLQSTWAGVEPLLAVGLRRDYLLTSAKGVFGRQIAEYVLCYLLVHSQRVLPRLASQRRHEWEAVPPGSLAGSRLGVLGTGSIGAEVAKLARAFDLRVRGCSRSGRPVEGFDEVFPVTRRLDFARGLDHLVVVLPATDETEGLVDAALIAMLRPGAVLVNVGRGSTIVREAVVRALESGHLAEAVLDVLEVEPPPADDPLWDTPNAILTFHTAAVSRPEAVVEAFLANFARYRAGRPLEGVVSFERGY